MFLSRPNLDNPHLSRVSNLQSSSWHELACVRMPDNGNPAFPTSSSWDSITTQHPTQDGAYPFFARPSTSDFTNSPSRHGLPVSQSSYFGLGFPSASSTSDGHHLDSASHSQPSIDTGQSPLGSATRSEPGQLPHVHGGSSVSVHSSPSVIHRPPHFGLGDSTNRVAGQTSQGDDGESDCSDIPEEGGQSQDAEFQTDNLAARKKMKRFRLTHSQSRFLTAEFAKQPHPDAAHREYLSAKIPGLSPRQVQVWFQNRRAKMKRHTQVDRDRILRMRAVPDGFDTVQALQSPYGAVAQPPSHPGSAQFPVQQQAQVRPTSMLDATHSSLLARGVTDPGYAGDTQLQSPYPGDQGMQGSRPRHDDQRSNAANQAYFPSGASALQQDAPTMSNFQYWPNSLWAGSPVDIRPSDSHNQPSSTDFEITPFNSQQSQDYRNRSRASSATFPLGAGLQRRPGEPQHPLISPIRAEGVRSPHWQNPSEWETNMPMGTNYNQNQYSAAPHMAPIAVPPGSSQTSQVLPIRQQDIHVDRERRGMYHPERVSGLDNVGGQDIKAEEKNRESELPYGSQGYEV